MWEPGLPVVRVGTVVAIVLHRWSVDQVSRIFLPLSVVERQIPGRLYHTAANPEWRGVLQLTPVNVLNPIEPSRKFVSQHHVEAGGFGQIIGTIG